MDDTTVRCTEYKLLFIQKTGLDQSFAAELQYVELELMSSAAVKRQMSRESICLHLSITLRHQFMFVVASNASPDNISAVLKMALYVLKILLTQSLSRYSVERCSEQKP